MKAQVLRGPSDLALGEIATPTSAGGQVVVRITHSGICGTDWKIFNGSIPVKYPRVMGHEMAGEVVDAGASTQVRVGDRVIIDPETYCGQCFHCNIGQTHLCPNGTLIGRDQNGGFAEYLAVPPSRARPANASTSAGAAASSTSKTSRSASSTPRSSRRGCESRPEVVPSGA